MMQDYLWPRISIDLARVYALMTTVPGLVMLQKARDSKERKVPEAS